MAIGRVGLREGIQPLTTALGDTDPDVREMAAFGLGLIGDVVAAPALTAALADASPMVRGRAAEALGQIALNQAQQIDPAARKEVADAIGRVAAEYARSPAVVSMQPDDDRWPAAPEAEAFRLGVYALVRLHAYEPLAAAVLDSDGHRVTTWWPVAYALGRIEDSARATGAAEDAQGAGKIFRRRLRRAASAGSRTQRRWNR